MERSVAAGLWLGLMTRSRIAAMPVPIEMSVILQGGARDYAPSTTEAAIFCDLATRQSSKDFKHADANCDLATRQANSLATRRPSQHSRNPDPGKGYFRPEILPSLHIWKCKNIPLARHLARQESEFLLSAPILRDRTALALSQRRIRQRRPALTAPRATVSRPVRPPGRRASPRRGQRPGGLISQGKDRLPLNPRHITIWLICGRHAATPGARTRAMLAVRQSDMSIQPGRCLNFPWRACG